MRTLQAPSSVSLPCVAWTAGLLALVACSAPPPTVEPPPVAPLLAHAAPAPRPPAPPEHLRLTPVSAPEPPAVWSQKVAEVFGESYSLDAVPVTLPIAASNVIVASVPEHTGPELRTALLGGFLSSGYLVKDAGVFTTGSFRVDPSVGPTGGFQRSVPGDAATTSISREDVVTSRTYSGLEAMTLEFSDPTSLWVPDLLANENLDADYFLRVFELSVEDGETRVPLAAVYDKGEVDEYRRMVELANELVVEHNQRIARFASDVADYSEAYALYEASYEKWAERDRSDHQMRVQRYERDWQNWQASQVEAIDELRTAGVIEASWERPAATPSYRVPTGKTAPEPMALPEVLPHFSTEALDAALAHESEARVPCRRVRILAELVDAKTGLVSWVGEVNGIAPMDVPRTEVLRRAVRYMAQR